MSNGPIFYSASVRGDSDIRADGAQCMQTTGDTPTVTLIKLPTSSHSLMKFITDCTC